MFVEEPLQWSQNLVVVGCDSVRIWCGVCGSGELLLSLNAGYALRGERGQRCWERGVGTTGLFLSCLQDRHPWPFALLSFEDVKVAFQVCYSDRPAGGHAWPI